MKVAIYARVSTADQHCEQQLETLRHYCQARQWTIAAEYVDQGVSGTKKSRPALDKLMKAARSREIDCVAVVKLDRFGRSTSHLMHALSELESAGVRFLAIDQGIDTDQSNPIGRLLRTILAAIAEFERDLIVDRTNAGLQRARREGRIGGRRKKVFDRSKVKELSAAGASMREIAAELKVSPATVCRILESLNPSPREVT